MSGQGPGFGTQDASAHESQRRARRRAIGFGLVFPVTLTAVSVVLQLLWLPSLPSPAATHWSAAGEVNGTGPAWSLPVITLVIGLALPTTLGVLALASIDSGRRSAAVLVAVAAGPGSVVTVVLALSVAVQRGLASAHDARLPWWVFLVVLLVEIVVGVCVFLTFPEVPSPERAGPALPPATLVIPEGATLAWTRAARAPWLLIAVILIAILVTGAFGVGALVAGALDGLVPLGGTVLLSMSALLLQVRVTVGAAGVTVAGELGLPRIRIPYAQIAGVSAIEVSAVGDFGGYGIRSGRGGVIGVVLRSGEALRIERARHRTLVVTVPDAATAAAAIETMRARHGVG